MGDKEEHDVTTSTEILAPWGYSVAAFVRAAIFSVKKGVVMAYVKKRAFLRLGALTDTARVQTAKKVTYQEYFTVLTKNTILGMSVFGSYEYIAYHLLADNLEKVLHDQASDDNNDNVTIHVTKSLYVTAAEQSPVVAHFGAGVCSGLAQSLVMTGWEHWTKPKGRQQSWPYIGRRAVHHAVGYASLFGSYEWFRRHIHHGLHSYLLTEDHHRDMLIMMDDYPWMRREDGLYDVTPIALLTSFVAGGFAGQVQHVVSQATSQWQRTGMFVPRGMPFAQGTLGAFIPSALAFVAFQYGGELTERMMEDRKSQL